MIRKGTYVLFLRFDRHVEAEVGSLGLVPLEAGTYCYVGSAMNGLDQRVSRHLSHEKRIRWHIDHLTTVCDDMAAYEHEGTTLSECNLAKLMTSIGNMPAADGFGCSDCDCQTHLFKVDRARTENELEHAGMSIFRDRRTEQKN